MPMFSHSLTTVNCLAPRSPSPPHRGCHCLHVPLLPPPPLGVPRRGCAEPAPGYQGTDTGPHTAALGFKPLPDSITAEAGSTQRLPSPARCHLRGEGRPLPAAPQPPPSRPATSPQGTVPAHAGPPLRAPSAMSTYCLVRLLHLRQLQCLQRERAALRSDGRLCPGPGSSLLPQPAASGRAELLPWPRGTGSLSGPAAADSAGCQRPWWAPNRTAQGPSVETRLPAALEEPPEPGSRFPRCHRGLGSKWDGSKGCPYPCSGELQDALKRVWEARGVRDCSSLPAVPCSSAAAAILLRLQAAGGACPSRGTPTMVCTARPDAPQQSHSAMELRTMAFISSC